MSKLSKAIANAIIEFNSGLLTQEIGRAHV